MDKNGNLMNKKKKNGFFHLANNYINLSDYNHFDLERKCKNMRNRNIKIVSYH